MSNDGRIAALEYDVTELKKQIKKLEAGLKALEVSKPSDPAENLRRFENLSKP